jgi:hypothetical protein
MKYVALILFILFILFLVFITIWATTPSKGYKPESRKGARVKYFINGVPVLEYY